MIRIGSNLADETLRFGCLLPELKDPVLANVAGINAFLDFLLKHTELDNPSSPRPDTSLTIELITCAQKAYLVRAPPYGILIIAYTYLVISRYLHDTNRPARM